VELLKKSAFGCLRGIGGKDCRSVNQASLSEPERDVRPSFVRVERQEAKNK
jgi:hypothetical protein